MTLTKTFSYLDLETLLNILYHLVACKMDLYHLVAWKMDLYHPPKKNKSLSGMPIFCHGIFCCWSRRGQSVWRSEEWNSGARLTKKKGGGIFSTKHLLSQWLNFKLSGVTYLVGKIKFKLFFSGSIGWVRTCIPERTRIHGGCWTKNRGGKPPPKMDGENNGKPY